MVGFFFFLLYRWNWVYRWSLAFAVSFVLILSKGMEGLVSIYRAISERDGPLCVDV